MRRAGAGVRHLYVHLPFCSHRCGYCDFVTVVGRNDRHGEYVEALLRELEREQEVLADPVSTVFIGGGTPSFTEPGALRRLLGAVPAAPEVTVEANPESVTPELAVLLHDSRRDAGLARRPDVRPPAARSARTCCRTRRHPTRGAYSS